MSILSLINELLKYECGHRELTSHSYYLLSSRVHLFFFCHLPLASCLLPHNLLCF